MKQPNKRGNSMKKLYTVVAVAALMGATSSWAQTTNITQGLDITISGTLVPGVQGQPNIVNDASLSDNTNPISFVHLEVINGTTTNFERWIGQISGGTTNLFLKEIRHENNNTLNPDSHEFALVFGGSGLVGSSSNAVIFVDGADTVKVKKGVTNETVKAKLQGVWVENPVDSDEVGGQAVVGGSLDSVKDSSGSE
jgi:hypothetical protein